MTLLTNLRCEYRTNPLGLDVARPRLSWEQRDERRGARQSAFLVQVASDEHALLDGSSDLWDSGTIDGDQSAHVVYRGRPLMSGERAYWRVRIWDGDGKASAWSEVAWWEMGLLKASDWRAAWIGGPEVGGPHTTSPAPFLRTSFSIPQPVVRARLYITALGLYEAHLNGQVIGADVLTPGWTDYAVRVQYQVYDVTGLLQPGANVLGAVLGDGWYAGYVGWFERQRYGDRPRLLAQLVVTYADGSTDTIATDGRWQVAYGPIVESDLLMGERYDARREIPGWDTPGYDDTGWQPVESFADPGIARSAMCGPTVQRITELQPVAEPHELIDGQGSRWIFDLGQNMVGRLRLRVSGPAGTTVRIRHAEVLNSDGTLYTENLRTAKQTDHYTLKGSGEEVWEPRFTFHGFRYVEVSGFPGVPTRQSITGIVIHSATPPTGSFRCSDPLLNQLQQNIVWGQRGNFVDVPTDCPQRNERLGWTGDAQVFIRTAAFNMDVAGFFTKWCRDLEDAQSPEGAYPAVAPNPGAGADGGPAWGDAGIICPWTIFQCYGDTNLLEQCYASMQRFVDFLARTSRGGLRCFPEYDGWQGFGDWLALDGATDRSGLTPKELIGTAFFAYSARLLGQMAAVLGKRADAERYAALFEEVRRSFQARFLASDGQMVGGTQTSYVLALHFDLLPEHARPAALDALVRDIEQRDMHLSTGFVGTPYIAWVLSDNGRSDVAHALLRQTSWPSWLYSVTRGATTIWERWDGWTDDRGFQDPAMNSFNHYAYGAIGDWMYAMIGGIDVDPQRPGYKRVVMRLSPGRDLHSAAAELRSIYGPIRSAWTLRDARLVWDITVPPNTSALVHVPVAPDDLVLEGGAPAAKAIGVTLVRRDATVAVYEVASGTYHFTAGARAADMLP